MKMITVKTCNRIKRGWSKTAEKTISMEDAAKLYQWVHDHPTYKDQFESAKIGQEVLVHLYGTCTQLCEVWKLAGLSDDEINELPFWKGK